MAHVSPTLEGFRAAFRRPSLAFAEIVWRWTVGATAAALLLFGLIQYLGTLPVSARDLLLLRSRQPLFVGRAISHIVQGTAGRVVVAGVLAALGLTLLWILIASLGRMATVRGLREYFIEFFAERTAEENLPPNSFHEEQNSGVAPASYRALTGLHFFRASAALAATLSFFGAAILAGFASPDSHPRPGLAFLLFLPLAALVFLAAWALNWFLSLAGIFAVRDGESAQSALGSAVTFCRERLGPVAAVSLWFGMIHLALWIVASSVVFFPLGFAAILPGRLVLALVLLLALASFAIVDWLYLARLAAYVCILEMPEELRVPVPALPPVSPAGGTKVEFTIPASAIDQNENILSDVPGLA
jgi:hypothetical protein